MPSYKKTIVPFRKDAIREFLEVCIVAWEEAAQDDPKRYGDLRLMRWPSRTIRMCLLGDGLTEEIILPENYKED